MQKIEVYLEIGKKRTFAGALDWPGWCRSAGSETEALQALVNYAPRYGRAIQLAKLGFRAPANASELLVTERMEGSSGTDFGAPSRAPSSDAQPVGGDDLERLKAVFRACWRALDEISAAAAGKELRTGPRGGGRDLQGILRHVLGGEEAYISAVGGKCKLDPGASLEAQFEQARQAALEALAASARGEIAPVGPRGGVRWSPRYFVRRAAWHVLDHAWEIEDRVIDGGAP